MTYAQLLAAAGGLAGHLAELGVVRGSLVGLCAARSPELVAGMLGILMAGGAYVPLDPAFPAERLGFMVRDAGIRVLLAQGRLARRVPAHGATVVALEGAWDGGGSGASTTALDEGGPDDPVWVIYTSGSTGEPKGVVALHRGLSNFLDAMQELLGLDEDDVMLALSSPSFDPSALEIFLPLIVGGRVVLVPGEETIFGGRLAGLLDSTGATIMQATPTGWRLLLGGGWGGRPGLTMLSGGEPLSPELASELLARGETLWNLYGPTETTVWCSAHRVLAGEVPVPIGQPIENMRFDVLGPDREPIAPGELGELAISGPGVTLGYLGRPELTATRFVSDPAGGRVYLSGDLARQRPDGGFEFAGRLDEQVKVRGYRIELGEVEGALASHPDVRAAAACARGEEAERRLVGYAVLREGSAATARHLRRHVAERLPSYMVPADVVLLDGLPLTPTGKLDRAALPPVSQRP